MRRILSTFTPPGTGSSGSQIRFAISGQSILDKPTGQVGRNTIISTCRAS